MACFPLAFHNLPLACFHVFSIPMRGLWKVFSIECCFCRFCNARRKSLAMRGKRLIAGGIYSLCNQQTWGIMPFCGELEDLSWIDGSFPWSFSWRNFFSDDFNSDGQFVIFYNHGMDNSALPAPMSFLCKGTGHSYNIPFYSFYSKYVNFIWNNAISFQIIMFHSKKTSMLFRLV